MTADDTEQKRIAALNDEFRRAAPSGQSNVPGKVLVTRGISALAPDEQFNVLAKVRDFDNFTPGDDPYKEHDFGVFEIEGEGKAYFKIDYYADENMEFGSQDPSDPNRSYRVMTIMLAHEY